MSPNVRRLSIVSMLALFGLVAWIYYQSGAPAREAERLQAEAQSVGTTASIAGAFLASALSKCSAIGVPRIEDCRVHSGPLLQDATAPMVAQLAANQRESYLHLCRKHYPEKYCEDLLFRAVKVSQASGP